MYKKITGSKGDRYLKNGKLVKKADVPEEVIEQLKTHASVAEPEEVIDRSCIFCGAFGKYSRLINLRTVYLCQEHYYDTTIGKVAEKLRSSHEKVNT